VYPDEDGDGDALIDATDADEVESGSAVGSRDREPAA
jgi:hypothetical protein